MKTFIFIPVLSALFSFAAPTPFKTQHAVRFATAAEFPMLGFAQVPEFKGTLVRTSDFPALQTLDVYEFPSQDSKLDPEKCREIVAKILGSEKNAGYKITKNEVIKGTVCDTRAGEQDKLALVNHRIFRAKQLNGKIYAVTARFEKSSIGEEDAEFAEVFDSLK